MELNEQYLQDYNFFMKATELPDGWELASLQNISFIVTDGTHKTPNYQPYGIRFISIKNIRPFVPINWLSYEKYITLEEHRELTKRCYPEYDDILFPRIGTLGFAKRIDFEEEVSIFVGLGLIKPVKQYIFPKYLEYYMNTPYISRLSEEKANGTGRMTLPLEESRCFPVPIPPLNEQKRIVAKIEELFSELDNGIENLKTAREQLKVYRQAVLKQAFESKLTSCKYKWKEVSFGQLTSLVTSGSRGWAKYYSDTGDLFIRAQNLKYDRLDLTEKAYVSLPNKTEGTRTLVQRNDLLITITGANVTKSALIEKDLGTAYVSQHVALCRPVKEVYAKFLYWFIVAEAAGRRQLNKAAYGAGKPGLNLDNIKSVQISMPSYQEQVAMVEDIEDKLFVCKQFEQDIDIAISNCDALRQSILKKAFSGKLVAQDPNDEPARVLLEHIYAEKEAQKTESKNPKTKRNAA